MLPYFPRDKDPTYSYLLMRERLPKRRVQKWGRRVIGSLA
jgi:hypothetical protein